MLPLTSRTRIRSRAVRARKLSQEASDSARSPVFTTLVIDDFADRELIIEARPAIEEVKLDLSGDWTASSSSRHSDLDVHHIVHPGVPRMPRRTPERVVGMHFFNPVLVMALAEIVVGLRTAESVADYATNDVAKRLSKDPSVQPRFTVLDWADVPPDSGEQFPEAHVILRSTRHFHSNFRSCPAGQMVRWWPPMDCSRSREVTPGRTPRTNRSAHAKSGRRPEDATRAGMLIRWVRSVAQRTRGKTRRGSDAGGASEVVRNHSVRRRTALLRIFPMARCASGPFFNSAIASSTIA
ncbi:3-hydroxyacyl-CoA dehydrogenase NAD-binding domain-containing protein [Rhodococcus sp. NPDC019627]|uniref:3-hydroxyacyl-CoA dehydrogenase NAD-binding domain-containing protein n=1 Tax=unclassified Rhodococcus (in: high G+C Gram-positive bacteria) TaxID=192944 RepID=UPI00340866DF